MPRDVQGNALARVEAVGQRRIGTSDLRRSGGDRFSGFRQKLLEFSITLNTNLFPELGGLHGRGAIAFSLPQLRTQRFPACCNLCRYCLRNNTLPQNLKLLIDSSIECLRYRGLVVIGNNR